MTVLVACETILLALLVLLVAGLLRSHAEILRRLGPADGSATRDDDLPDPPERAAPDAPAELVGTTLEGDAMKVTLGPGSPPTLIAFLTSGCSACHNFWNGLRAGVPRELGAREVRLVVVTKDSSHESPSRLDELWARDVPVLMSTAAWDAHAVPAAPYFVFVDDGVVRGEGSATTWKQIGSLLRDAERDAQRAAASNGHARTDHIDQILEASGIGPGHSSLYPSGQEDAPQ